MGAVIKKEEKDNLSVLGSFSIIKSESLSIQNYSKISFLSSGVPIVKLENGRSGLFYSRLVMQSYQMKVLQTWVNTKYQHSCNVLKYELERSLMMCGNHSNFKAILEYGDCRLDQMLKKKDESPFFESSQSSLGQVAASIPLETLQIIKMLLEAVEEHLDRTGQWISFHTSNLVYFRQLKRFKFLFLPQFDGLQEREAFFDPYTTQYSIKTSENTTVFSIGMILLCLLLREDCSDCYNYHNLAFCWSIFEDKKQRANEVILAERPNEFSLTQFAPSVEEGILNLAMEALSFEHRLSFADIKNKYYRLLRKISTDYVTDDSFLIQKKKIRNLMPEIKQRHKTTIDSEFDNSENKNLQNVSLGLSIYDSSFVSLILKQQMGEMGQFVPILNNDKNNFQANKVVKLAKNKSRKNRIRTQY